MKAILSAGLALAAMMGGAALAAPAIGAASGAVGAAGAHLGSGGTPSAMTAADGTAGLSGPAGSLGSNLGEQAQTGGSGTGAALGANAGGTVPGASGGVGASASGFTPAHAGALGLPAGASVDSLAASGASASLDATNATRDIRAASLDARDRVVSVVRFRVEASERAMARLAHSARRLDDSARKAFDERCAEVRAREKALRSSLHGAAAATYDTWDYARAKLALNYEAYSIAVTRAELAEQGQVGGGANDRS